MEQDFKNTSEVLKEAATLAEQINSICLEAPPVVYMLSLAMLYNYYKESPIFAEAVKVSNIINNEVKRLKSN